MLKIRTYIVLMAAAILLPVVVFSTISLHLLRNGERDAALRGLHETARATALTVDREMASVVTALELLARSPYLESGDLQAFYKQALQANKRATSWTMLLDENAQQLINTARPFGEPLPSPRPPDMVQKVMAAQKPLVSDLMLGQVTKKLITVMYVPVPAHGGKRSGAARAGGRAVAPHVGSRGAAVRHDGFAADRTHPRARDRRDRRRGAS